MKPISPVPLIEIHPGALPAYLSNGVVGLRVQPIPLQGTAIVNGYVGVDPVERVEGFDYAPYPLGLDMGIGNNWISDQPEHVRFISADLRFLLWRTAFSF